jgi:HPt (histidine-containing phosphotransfer) domain-containing protein
MTANIMAGDIDLYKAQGMDDHVGKPFTSQELWRCLLKYLAPVEFQSISAKVDTEDTQLQKQLKADFVKDNQKRYEEVKNAIGAGDLKLAHRLVHTLKSTAALIGQPKLQNIAAALEASLKGGENRATAAQLEILQSELHTVLDELSPYAIEQTGIRQSEDAPAAFDMEKAYELLAQLEPLLKSGNSECLDFLDSLRLIPGSEELIQQIEDFCFSEAAELLLQLKARLAVDIVA